MEGLAPVQKRYKEIREDKDMLESICKTGAEKASHLAQRTLRKVYRKVGFAQF